MTPKRANAFMWTALGCVYGLNGAPWFAVAAMLLLALTEEVIDEVR